MCSFEGCINKVFRPGRMIKCRTHASTGRNLGPAFADATLPPDANSAAGTAGTAGTAGGIILFPTRSNDSHYTRN